jgi:cobalt-zinc-cadmium resistance protein CzcA
LNEGDIVVQALRIPGTSLTQSVQMQMALEKTIGQVPEVQRVFSRVGTAEIANDPMPPNLADTYIILKPTAQWPSPRRSQTEVVAAIHQIVGQVPGNNFEFSQPIQMRFNELISGVRTDVAVKVFGDDMDQLHAAAGKIVAVLERLQGAESVAAEQTTGLPMLTIAVDRQQAARYGVRLADVQDIVATAVGGREAGIYFDGDRRFNIVVRLPNDVRSDIESLKRLPIALPAADGNASPSFVPLSELAHFSLAPGPNQISREDGKRRMVVSANVGGRDLGSFVAEAKEKVAASAALPPGYWISWGGTFEQLQSATARLQWVVPIALALVLVLLFVVFGNIKDGLIVFTGIPFALTGGVLALWLRDIPLSITAVVGFIALSGVAVLNGLVMLSFIRALRDEGKTLDEAIRLGAISRLRPVLMTALVASMGFIPMALATGTGAEVQRPLATVVIGGILSSTALTLLILPILYGLAHQGLAHQGWVSPPENRRRSAA